MRICHNLRENAQLFKEKADNQIEGSFVTWAGVMSPFNSVTRMSEPWPNTASESKVGVIIRSAFKDPDSSLSPIQRVTGTTVTVRITNR